MSYIPAILWASFTFWASSIRDKGGAQFLEMCQVETEFQPAQSSGAATQLDVQTFEFGLSAGNGETPAPQQGLNTYVSEDSLSIPTLRRAVRRTAASLLNLTGGVAIVGSQKRKAEIDETTFQGLSCGTMRKDWCDYVKAHKAFPAAVDSSKFPPCVRTSANTYKITEKQLGSGTFGAVHLAAEVKQCSDTPTKFTMAAKWDAKAEDLQLAKEFLIQHAINNKHVVRAIDAFTVGPNRILIIEAMHGGELFDMIAATKHGLDEQKVKDFAGQLVLGLAAIHKENFVHLDIKLENVLVSSSKDTVKWIDFGVAEVCPGEVGCHLLVPQGTLEFMAPEVIGGRKNKEVSFGKKSDVWSLGVLFYVMCYKRYPFGSSLAKGGVSTTRILEGMFEFPSYKKASSGFEDLIMRMLRSDTAARITLQQVQEHSWFGDKEQQTKAEAKDEYVEPSLW